MSEKRTKVTQLEKITKLKIDKVISLKLHN